MLRIAELKTEYVPNTRITIPAAAIRFCVEHFSRLEQILQMEMMLAKFSAVVASGNTKNILRRCRRVEPTFHCGLHGFKRETIDNDFINRLTIPGQLSPGYSS